MMSNKIPIIDKKPNDKSKKQINDKPDKKNGNTEHSKAELKKFV